METEDKLITYLENIDSLSNSGMEELKLLTEKLDNNLKRILNENNSQKKFYQENRKILSKLIEEKFKKEKKIFYKGRKKFQKQLKSNLIENALINSNIKIFLLKNNDFFFEFKFHDKIIKIFLNKKLEITNITNLNNIVLNNNECKEIYQKLILDYDKNFNNFENILVSWLEDYCNLNFSPNELFLNLNN